MAHAKENFQTYTHWNTYLFRINLPVINSDCDIRKVSVSKYVVGEE